MTEQQRHVLVVDDDADTRALLGSLLAREALTVDFAVDGAEALDLIQQRNYSVVLLDLVMPGMDGFSVLDRLNAPGMPSPVVIVITGADRAAIDKLDPHRIHGVVRKPFDPTDLAALVVACANIKSSGAFGTMAIATMLAGGSILELLNRLAR
jgi:CheY-like chemotaxis protein